MPKRTPKPNKDTTIKDLLKNVATKDDIKNMATKDDIKNMATKDDLKEFVTKSEFNNALDNLVLKSEFDDRVRQVVEEVLDEKIRFIPTKDEFFTKMDEVMGELKAIREEQKLLSGQNSEHRDTLDNHEVRIKVLEKRHSSNPTQAFPSF